MNKKEEIRQLKQQLRIAKSSCFVAEKALQPFQNCCVMRGARMQLMIDHMKLKNVDIPEYFKDWFDIRGVPKL